MKWLLLGVILLSVFVGGCAKGEQIEPSSSPDVPQYSADQVIYVAKSYSPTFSEYEQARYMCNEEPSWSAEYRGYGLWLVKKYAINRFTSERYYVEGWIFNEQTGKLGK